MVIAITFDPVRRNLCSMTEVFETWKKLSQLQKIWQRFCFSKQCQDLNTTSLLSVSFQTQTSQLSHRRNQHLFFKTRETALNELLPVVQKRSQVSVLKNSFHKLPCLCPEQWTSRAMKDKDSIRHALRWLNIGLNYGWKGRELNSPMIIFYIHSKYLKLTMQ